MSNEKKEFSFNTIENFDEHILQSIPNYDVLFKSIVNITDYFIDTQKNVYDIGCSTGKLLHFLSRSFPDVKMIGLDYSAHLLPKSENNISFVQCDLNEDFKFNKAGLIFSIFTLQFIKKENRQKVINNIYDSLGKGNAFIFAEKTYAKHPVLQDIFTFAYYDYKKFSFTEKEILDKEKDLRRILHPQTQEENIQMLHYAGFNIIEMFYKYLNFEGYICIK